MTYTNHHYFNSKGVCQRCGHNPQTDDGPIVCPEKPDLAELQERTRQSRSEYLNTIREARAKSDKDFEEIAKIASRSGMPTYQIADYLLWAIQYAQEEKLQLQKEERERKQAEALRMSKILGA